MRRYRVLLLSIAFLVLTTYVAGHPTRPATAQSAPATPALSIAFGPSEMWVPSRDATIALHQQCTANSFTPLFSCVQQVMLQDGASSDAVAFYQWTGWFLEDVKGQAPVQIGTILNPWRANENEQTAFLGGSPAVVQPEQEAAHLNIDQDPSYAGLKAAYPNLMYWAPGPTLEETSASPQGGQRFILDYRVLDGCHACAVIALARVAFDFAPDGTYEGHTFLNLTTPPSKPS